MVYMPPSDESKALISEALRTDPFAADLTLALAKQYQALGDVAIAAVIMNKYLQLAPNSPIGRFQ